MKNGLRRYRELSSEERLLLFRALFVVAIARVSLWMCPLKIARRVTVTAGSGAKRHSVEQLVWAIAAASRYVPRATCLTQALAIQSLLTHSGHQSQVEIGVAKGSRFEAHAWVVCGGEVIVGADEANRYCRILVWE